MTLICTNYQCFKVKLERWAGRNIRASEISDEVVNESAHEIVELNAENVHK